jgi:hypothetical protein
MKGVLPAERCWMREEGEVMEEQEREGDESRKEMGMDVDSLIVEV